MIRWMCGVKVIDRFTCDELGETLGTDDIITVIQQNTMRWYGHASKRTRMIGLHYKVEVRVLDLEVDQKNIGEL